MRLDSIVNLITNSSTVIYSYAQKEPLKNLLDMLGMTNYKIYVFPEYLYIYNFEDEILEELDAIFGWEDPDAEYSVSYEIEIGTIDATNVDILDDILKRCEVIINPDDEGFNTEFVVVHNGKILEKFNDMLSILFLLDEGMG